MTNPEDNMPAEVRDELAGIAATFQAANEAATATQDENYERIISALMDASDKIEEEKQKSERYLFDHEEFVATLDHVVADQLAALKNQALPEDQRVRLSPAEFAERFNRWFVFCDAVINLGFIFPYTHDAAKKENYEEVFKSLKLSKQFEAMFLKPRGIKVELSHKSPQVKAKYPWLAMPVLVLKDEAGVVHEIAITPSPVASVWWLDVLVSFHGSYDWAVADPDAQMQEEEGETEYEPPSLHNPFPDWSRPENNQE